MEHIRGINWDLWGQELSHEQAIQRLAVAGFPIYQAEPKPHSPLLTMFAIVEGESGEYQKAWHANVERDTDGNIKRKVVNGVTYMTVKSIDLGFCQFNTPLATPQNVEMTKEAMATFVEGMFTANPDLADPWKSAVRAFEMWKRRGFQPWYGWKPGTPEFKKKMKYGSLALGNWIVHAFVGRKDVDGKPLNLTWK